MLFYHFFYTYSLYIVQNNIQAMVRCLYYLFILHFKVVAWNTDSIIALNMLKWSYFLSEMDKIAQNSSEGPTNGIKYDAGEKFKNDVFNMGQYA